MQTPPLVIVSDVDGTLLDDAGAWPAPPRVLRARLEQVERARGTSVTLALASSRTLDELLALQRWLSWPGPCLAEDGALVAIDDDKAGRARRALEHSGVVQVDLRRSGRRTLLVVRLGEHTTRLRELLRACPATATADIARAEPRRQAQLGFGSPSRRRRSLTSRRASVLLDLPTHATNDAASNAVSLDIVRGGRWSTATRGAGKGNAVRWLRRVIDDDARVPCHIVGVGNGENDQSLLEAADTRFAIRSNSANALRVLSRIPEVVVLDTSGTRAWLDMLDRLAIGVAEPQS